MSIPSDETKSILGRLENLSFLLRALWTISGFALGFLGGDWLAHYFQSATFVAGGILVGMALGFIIGHYSAVFMDWAQQILVFQERIAQQVNRSEPNPPT